MKLKSSNKSNTVSSSNNQHYSAQDLVKRFADLILNSRNVAASFSSVDSIENHHARSLVFLANESNALALEDIKASVIVTTSELSAKMRHSDSCVIAVADVRLAQAKMKQAYNEYDFSDSEWDSIHPSAVIHSSARLGSNVRVGANSVIGRDVSIGAGSVVRSNCVIEHGAKIGQNCVVHNLVNIGYDCRIGNRVIVRPGAIIGNEGFGFAQDQEREYHRVPQTGTVEIHDDVQIGSNCNIDRATYGATIVSRGVKIDALCHIAHNVFIDEDALFVAQSGVAGSSNIGKRVIASGQTGVLDHKTVVDDAVLVHRCGVTEDILSPGMWAGTPPKPFKEYVRHVTLTKKVDKLGRKLVDVTRKNLNEQE